MVHKTIGGITCKLSLLFPAFLLLILQWDQNGIVLSGVAAAMLHETGHLIVCLLCRRHIRNLTVSFYGIRLQIESLSKGGYLQDILITAGGPLINMVCALWLYCLQFQNTLWLCHIGLAAVNLLPIQPLDGGNMFLAVLSMLFSDESLVNRITNAVSTVTVAALTALGIALFVYDHHNPSLLILSLYSMTFMLFYKGN